MATMEMNPKNLTTGQKRDQIIKALTDPNLTEAQAIALQIKLTNVLEEKRDEESRDSTILSHAQTVADKAWQEDRRKKDRANQKHQQNYGEVKGGINQAAHTQGAGLITAITTASAGVINDCYHAYHEWKVEDTYQRDQAEHGAKFGELDEAAKSVLQAHRQDYWANKSTAYKKGLVHS